MKGKPFSYPKVSIVMPVYNRRHHIRRAMNSVFKQTASDWELVIVDDGSEDRLFEVIEPLITNHNQLRYMRHPHRGLAYSRNAGIQAALGTFVTFLDSDDEYLADHLQLRTEYFDHHPAVALIHGGVELVGSPESHYVQDVFNPKKKIHISQCVVGASLFGKKSAFVELGGFYDLPYSAESEFLKRASKHFMVQKVEFPTYRYYTGLNDSVCEKVKRGEIQS